MFAMLSTWLIALIGLVTVILLIASAEVAVKKLMGLAGYFHLSTTFMGVTVVSLATSIPEMASHLTASVGILTGVLDYKVGSAVVLGANIGSDVVQQTLIMAIVVFMAGQLFFRRYFLAKSMIPMIVTTLMCLVLGWDRTYSRVDGLILFGSFFAYLYYLYRDERKHYNPLDHGFDENGDAPAGVPRSRGEAARAGLIALVALVDDSRQRNGGAPGHAGHRRSHRHWRLAHRRGDAGRSLGPARADRGDLRHAQGRRRDPPRHARGQQYHQSAGRHRWRSSFCPPTRSPDRSYCGTYRGKQRPARSCGSTCGSTRGSWGSAEPSTSSGMYVVYVRLAVDLLLRRLSWGVAWRHRAPCPGARQDRGRVT